MLKCWDAFLVGIGNLKSIFFLALPPQTEGGGGSTAFFIAQNGVLTLVSVGQGGGNCSRRTPQNCGKLWKNCGNYGKIAVFSEENCGRDLEKFRFPDSGQGKGRQKITSPNQAKTQQKFFSTYLWSNFINFDKNGC